MRTALFTALALATIPGAAGAHVVTSPDRATAGAYYAGELRVGHGCAGSPTTSLRVEIPPQVLSAKPQPKPGWRIAVERAPLAEPRVGEGGQAIRDRVAAITWTGLLPDDRFDAFGLMLRLPPEAGALLLPVVQGCWKGEQRWTEAPAADGARPAHPAPRLVLEPATPAAHVH